VGAALGPKAGAAHHMKQIAAVVRSGPKHFAIFANIRVPGDGA